MSPSVCAKSTYEIETLCAGSSHDISIDEVRACSKSIEGFDHNEFSRSPLEGSLLLVEPSLLRSLAHVSSLITERRSSLRPTNARSTQRGGRPLMLKVESREISRSHGG